MIPLTSHDPIVGIAMIVVAVVWCIPAIVVYVRENLRH